MFKRILVPLDGSERAEQALPIAARMARGSGASVILLQVVDVAALYYGQFAHPSLSEITLEAAGKYLTEVKTSEMFNGIPTEIHHPFGSVTSQILAVADSLGADSIVLTSHGYSGVTRWILGSVAEYVVRHASQPVLLVKDNEESDSEILPEHEYPVRVLVPLDGSFLAKSALEPAASLITALAAPARGTLHLTKVVKQGKAATAERYLRVIAQQVCEELLADEALNLKITCSVAVNQDAVEGIIGVAENGEHARKDGSAGSYDVIAMATNGRSGLQRWLMGSVTEGVLARTRFPLLVVRPAGEMDGSEADSETQVRKFPLTRPGAVSPRRYLMAIIDDVQEAEDAVQALHRANLPPEDIRLFERHEIIENAAHTERTRGLRSRIADVFQAVASDEDAHTMIYVEEALRGHVILNVYARTPEQAERIKDILVNHHARSIKYFGNWAITVLHH
jgi:nucleotide-binding universal stress UspA family protein